MKERKFVCNLDYGILGNIDYILEVNGAEEDITQELGANVVPTVEEIPVRTNWKWRNTKEMEGHIIGYCHGIGTGDPSRASEYVPVRFKNGVSLLHRSKVVGR